MIYYTDSITISQITHAHLARIIVEAIDTTRLNISSRLALAIACHYHDHGWQTWEKKPEINPTTKTPYSFHDVSAATHIEIWKRSREIAFEQLSLAGFMVGHHGIYLATMRKSNTTNTKDIDLLNHFILNEKNHLTQSIKNIPKTFSQTERDTWLTFLKIADYISLLVCLNTKQHQKNIDEHTITISQDKQGYKLSLPLLHTIDYTLRGFDHNSKKDWKREIKISGPTH